MTQLWLIRSTFAKKDEAVLAAKTLLAEKWVACVNISENMTSIYHWEGTMQQENEHVMMGKTTAAKALQACERLKAIHPYQIPSIVAWPVGFADPAFTAWVESEIA